MPKLILCRGISASGKSAFAKEMEDHGYYEINRDNHRFSLFCDGEHDWSLYKFTKYRENQVTEECEEDFNEAVSYSYNIVVSNTNLNLKDVDYWKEKAESVGYEFEIKLFDISLEEALKRDSKRGALQVGREVILQQWKKWLDVIEFKRYIPNEYKPNAIIVDIDGTIALTNGRSHYDYSDAVLTDSARGNVMELVESYSNYTNSHTIIVSGRESVCKAATEQWLNKYLVDYTSIHMRPEGDSRSDRIVKQEIFWEHIEPYYNVLAAFDDRPRVIRLWKDIGIPLVVDVDTDYLEF